MINNLLARSSIIKKELFAGNLNAVLTRFSDLLLVGCVAGMIGLMIVPLPTLLLDICLTVNIAMAMTILMVSIYISNATQIASYPTLLLITTLYRLSLDISATRLILLKADAGEVIRSFGMFVVGGNFVVGAVIFLIITLVQFIVITKGAERVAEVAARFTLDAMPGKQMSIDADMRSGTIDFKEARRRRQALSRESQFYGAMDGAMKFVKGDAIAGIIITVINIVGGLVIGVAMSGMSFQDAVQTYSILTIGNGLVSQIPALLISLSAGMVVTRVASEDESSNLGRDIAVQVLSQPKAIAVVSGILCVMALIPGLPKGPFFLLSGISASVSYGLFRAVKGAQTEEAGKVVPGVAEPEFSVTLPVFVQAGPELLSYVDLETDEGQAFFRKLAELRNALYIKLGIIFPPIQISGNLPHKEHNYVIWLNEVPVAYGRIQTDSVLVNCSAGKIASYGIKGEATRNPATGHDAVWVPRREREKAEAAGLQVWDTHEVLTLHLATFLRRHAVDFVGVQEVRWMLDRTKQYYPALVEEVTPKPLSLQHLTDILKLLAREEVSIRDLKTILQSLGEYGRTEQDASSLAEHVRVALKRKICYSLTEGKPVLFVYQLDPEVQDTFRNSMRQNADGSYLAMNRKDLERLTSAAHTMIGELPPTAQRPVIVADKDIRRFVWKALEHEFPDLHVISYQELTPDIKVHSLGIIG
jgi:type III secretion protein V